MQSFKHSPHPPYEVRRGSAVISIAGDGSVVLEKTAALVANGVPGVAGQILTSNGPGVAPTWQSNAAVSYPVTVAHGGTGADFSATAQGNIWYFSAAGVVSALAPGTAGYVLTTHGAGANPTWAVSSGGTVTMTSNTTNKLTKSTGANTIGDAAATDDGTTFTVAEKTVVSAGGFQMTGIPGVAPVNTSNTSATINVAAGSHAGANDTIASVDFYRSSTFKGAVGMDAASASVIAGHTHANTDFWVIGQSGNYSVVIASDDHVYVKGQLSLGDKFYPATDGAAGQSATAIYGNTGAPNNANGANGDFYFRADGGAGTTIYQRRAGAWVGVV